MDNDEDSEEPHSPQQTRTLHAHRLDHNPSKLPAFRFVDLNSAALGLSSLLSRDTESASASPTAKHGTSSSVGTHILPTTASTPLSPYSPTRRPSTSPAGSVVGTSYFPLAPSQPTPPFYSRLQDKRTRRAPASHSSNGIETATGPPPALSTQRSSAAEAAHTPNTSTTEWALAQQQLAFQTLNSATTSTDALKTANNARSPRGGSKSLDESTSTRPLIPPIRSFRSSTTRASLEMNATTLYRYEAQADDHENDRNRTLRALEGLTDTERSGRGSHTIDVDDQRQTDPVQEDLFLNIARDDQGHDSSGDNFSRTERRRSRIALASSRPSLSRPPISYQQPIIQSGSRRSSDVPVTPIAAPGDDNLPNVLVDRLPYHPSTRAGSAASSVHPAGDHGNRSRYPPLSYPSTPRGELQLLSGGRRSSIPDTNASISSRSHSYRQSNLSYSTPRVYNSSPLITRSKEVEDGLEPPRLPEGTESTVSTTAPSTVWDELDDLKSRIRKLELTGKLPATSGAAISRASGERPPTATTTITTMSTSPKRGRGLSTSPVEPTVMGQPLGEIHPLLHSALAKSKTLLDADVFKALEAATSDAITIAAMTGSAGQSGPMSSSQSVVGNGASSVTDRQLRRKADSLCRSLTELCIALSEVRPEQPQNQAQQPGSQIMVRPASRDRDFTGGTPDASQRSGDGLARVKSSPRALSRLEARRSSLLATSSLSTPRYSPSEAPTPTQSTSANRRTSLLLRSRRVGTEEPEDEEARFRAPSRAATDIVRTRNSPREYTSQQPLPETRVPVVQSSLPLRRHFVSSSTNSSIPQAQALASPVVSNRRFLDRSTPERDISNNNVINKLAEERGQRSVGTVSALAYEGSTIARARSLNKARARPQLRERGDTETSTETQTGGYP